MSTKPGQSQSQTWASTRSDTPPGSTISIRPSCRGGDGGSADRGAIGVGSGIGDGALVRSAPRWQSVVPPGRGGTAQAHHLPAPGAELPRADPVLARTSAGVRSGPKLSATISRFCSSVHERRRSGRTTSLRRPSDRRPSVELRRFTLTTRGSDDRGDYRWPNWRPKPEMATSCARWPRPWCSCSWRLRWKV